MSKKNIIPGILLFLFAHIIYAQKVGINTDDPLTALDINGIVQIRKDIKLGGIIGTAGSPGAAGQAFTSQGAGKSPIWSPMGIDVSLGFGITQSVVLTDTVGTTYISDTPITQLTAEYLEDSELSTANGWTELTKLRSEIRPTKANNRLVATLQTVAQSASVSYIADAEVAIGIFVDGKLKSVRPIHVGGSNMTFTVGTLFDSFENLPVKANNEAYIIRIATALRYHNLLDNNGSGYDTDRTILVGTSNLDTNNTNKRMNMTSLKLELYEEIE